MRVAGSVDNQQQREHHANGDSLENAKRQLASDDKHGDSDFPRATLVTHTVKPLNIGAANAVGTNTTVGTDAVGQAPPFDLPIVP
jgi:hypothetical protein